MARFNQKNRLRWSIVLFMIVLAVPLVVLIQHTFSQLQWETLHQNRLQAEALSARIDQRLQQFIEIEEKRSIGEYRFLSVTGNTNNAYIQRSPLSQLPLTTDVPGIVGYFQLDADNQLTTPMTPNNRTQALQYGLSSDEYQQRLTEKINYCQYSLKTNY